MIISNKRYKIALIGYRLSKGGGERVMARLSVFFEKNNIDVHNIIVIDEVSYPFSGKLVNLGKLKNQTNGPLNKLKRLLFLKNYLSENKFDFIIDFRFRMKPIQELLISRWVYNSKTIFTVHSYLIDNYMPNWTFLTQLMYKNSYKVVSVTNESKLLIEQKHQLSNVQTIYNPIDFDEIQSKCDMKIELNFDYIIGIGQMENNVKQFDTLIESYSNSVLPDKNIHLVLLGEGKLMNNLKNVASQKNMADNVHFLGYQSNPYAYLNNAKYLVLSSANEGLPNVILESLACQTPVIAFDCLSGPNEMIINKVNGLLVENQNVDKLTEAMNLFVADEKLYNYCKENALQSIQHFSIEVIGKQWLDLMNIIS